MEKKNINRLLPNPVRVEVDMILWSVIIITAAIQRGNRISTHGVESPGFFCQISNADGRKSLADGEGIVCLWKESFLRGKK